MVNRMGNEVSWEGRAIEDWGHDRGQTTTSSSKASCTGRSCVPEPCPPLCFHQSRASSQPDCFRRRELPPRVDVLPSGLEARASTRRAFYGGNAPVPILTLVSRSHGSVATVSQRAYVPRTSVPRIKVDDAR